MIPLKMIPARTFGLHALLALAALPLSVFAEKPLEAELNKMKASISAQVPPDMLKTLESALVTIEQTGITQKARQVGDTAPDFTLKNAAGREVSLKSLLAKGPVVLTWYRGSWCPYCNLTLAALQKVLPEFQAAGAQLVALTPELPDQSLPTAKVNELKFEVLTDLNHGTARDYGLVYHLPADVLAIYNQAFKIDLAKHDGVDAGSDTLPLSATYIIDQGGVIRYAFLDVDYRRRAEPAELVEFVKKMTAK